MSDIIQEMNLKNVLAGAAALALGATIGLHQTTDHGFHRNTELIQEHPARTDAREEINSLANTAKSKYKIDPEFAVHVASMAKKYEHPVFPKAKDLMGIIGIESSFNPDAKSKLRVDPARGLTQIRPKIWGLDHEKDLATPEQQIQKSAEILSAYHKRFDGDVEKAVHAYNVGATNVRRGTGLNPKYVEKFKKERSLYD